jgi:hypothetical protein
MTKLPRRFTLLRIILATALPLMFLFISVGPAAAQNSGSVRMTTTCFQKQVRPGQPVTCAIQITNSTTIGKQFLLTDIVAGGGSYPDTFISDLFCCGPSINQLNRQEYGPLFVFVPGLSSTTFFVTIFPYQTRSACINSFYANMSNEVHLQLYDFNTGQGTGRNLATARASFSVSCRA